MALWRISGGLVLAEHEGVGIYCKCHLRSVGWLVAGELIGIWAPPEIGEMPPGLGLRFWFVLISFVSMGWAS